MNMKFRYYNSWYLRYYYNIFATLAKFFFNYVFLQSGSNKKEEEERAKIKTVPISYIKDFINQEKEIVKVNKNPPVDLSNMKTVSDINVSSILII